MTLLDPEVVRAAAAAWVWVPPDAAEVRTDDYHLVAFPEHFADPTMVFRIDSMRPPADLVDELVARAAELGRHSMVLWPGARPPGLVDHLLTRGAVLHEELAVLARPIDPTADPAVELDAPGDVEVRIADDLTSQRDHERVGVEVFGGTMSPPSDEPDQDDITDGIGLVAYRGGQPVATAGLTVVDGVARLWGGATLPTARHTGAYRALLAARLRTGLEHGARIALVKGRVDTSAPILRRAGFEAYGEERGYLLPGS